VSRRLTDAGQDCHRRTFFRDRLLFRQGVRINPFARTRVDPHVGSYHPIDVLKRLE